MIARSASPPRSLARRLGLAAPPLLWASAIAWLSSRPALGAPPLLQFPHADKLVHAGIWFVLALLTARALAGLTAWRHPAHWAWLFAALYGVLDEWHQSFTPGRHSDLADVLADATGAALGAAAWLWVTRLRRARSQSSVASC